MEGKGIPLDSSNLIFQAVKALLSKYSIAEERPLKVINHIGVPVGKGLGSSATAVVAGLLATNKIYGLGLDTADLVCAGLQIEPHPDNIAPCLAGGLIICYEDGCCSYKKIEIEKDYKVMLLIPDFHINTHEARKLIPDKIPLKDAIFNISNFALLIKSLQEADLDGAAVFIRDKVHQPYRRGLYKKSMQLVDVLNEKYKIPSAISGSGPSVFSIMDKSRYEKYFEEIKINLLKEYSDFKIIITGTNNKGSWIE